jgi:hypothetical protein
LPTLARVCPDRTKNYKLVLHFDNTDPGQQNIKAIKSGSAITMELSGEPNQIRHTVTDKSSPGSHVRLRLFPDLAFVSTSNFFLLPTSTQDNTTLPRRPLCNGARDGGHGPPPQQARRVALG